MSLINHLLPRSSPEKQGISSKSILNLLEQLKKDGQDYHSLMIVKNGYVVWEGYWKPYEPEYHHMMFSLSKSFTSTAAGIAFDEGLFRTDDPIVSFFEGEISEEARDRYKNITVEHLLTMSTGQESDPTFSMRGYATWVEGFFAEPLKYEPGTQFMYNSAASYMISAIIQKVTGMKTLVYLQNKLFADLGIGDVYWDESPQGINCGGWGLRLRTEDIAKFGLLYLHKGMYNGKRLLSREWIEKATSKQIDTVWPTPDWQEGYGYQFWRATHNSFRGDGAFGQFCLVLPEQNMVIACTNGFNDMQQYISTIWMELVDRPCKNVVDTQEQTRLRVMTNALECEKKYGQPSSDLEKDISGKQYYFETNDYGFISFEINFQRDCCLFTLHTESGSHTVKAGRNHTIFSHSDMIDLIWPSISLGSRRDPNYKRIAPECYCTWIDPKVFCLGIRYPDAASSELWTIQLQKKAGKAKQQLSGVFEFFPRPELRISLKAE